MTLRDRHRAASTRHDAAAVTGVRRMGMPPNPEHAPMIVPLKPEHAS